jgi:hypothetical protein
MVDDVAREFADKGLIVLAIDVLDRIRRLRSTSRIIRDRFPSCSRRIPISPQCTTHRAIRST